MSKKITHSKKRLVKKGKRTQRKSVKRRNLKTIKGGMFKRAKNFLSKKKAQGFKTGNNRRQIGVAFNNRQNKINKTKSSKKRMNDFRDSLDINKLSAKLQEIETFYSLNPDKPEKINEEIETAKYGIGAIQRLQSMFKVKIDEHNEKLGKIMDGPLLISKVNDSVENLEASLGPLISQQKPFSSNLGKALENASKQIQNSLGDPWFLSRALKTAPRDYLIKEDNKFSIQKLFDNYLMKNKNLTNSVNGKDILESHRDSLIVQLTNDPIAIGQQQFGSTGPGPKIKFGDSLVGKPELSQLKQRELPIEESNISSQVTTPESFDVPQTSFSYSNPEGLSNTAADMLKYQARRQAEAEANPFQQEFEGTPPPLPEVEGSGEEVTPALSQGIATEGPTSPAPIKRDGSGGNGPAEPAGTTVNPFDFNVGDLD